MIHTYSVSGMTCNGCRTLVEESFFTLPHVEKVSVNLEVQKATIQTLGITTIGGIKTLWDKKSTQCACLSNVHNLPMTKTTFIENTTIIIMAVITLLKSTAI